MKAFLSHSSFDKDFVQSVYDELGQGNCVYDSKTFESNADLVYEVEKNIASCDLFVLFLSKQSMSSQWVDGEIDLAHELKLKKL